MANNTPATVNDQIELAKQLAASNLLPEQYRNRPANLIWAIQYAAALGVHPMTAITGISVIQGRPTASAQLIGGLVRRAGHKLRVESTESKAVATIIRSDDPDFTFRVEWTMERAKKAGLGGRGPWQQYPAAMLAARAITEVARLAAPECLFGVIYTPEELGADVNEEGEAAQAPAVSFAEELDSEQYLSRGAIRELAQKTEIDDIKSMGGTNGRKGLSVFDIDHEIPAQADPETKLAARNQVTRIAILRKELGIDDDAYRNRLQNLYGVRTSKELTETQAAELIQKLTAAKERGKENAAAI